jgi:hypothetical protein
VIRDSLDEMTMWRDASTSQRASQLSAAIFQAPFLVSLVAMNKVLALTHPLSKSLQKIDIDLLACVEEVSGIMNILRGWRDDAITSFEPLFEVATNLSTTPLEMPRIVQRQVFRANVIGERAIDYYRRVIWIPFLDGILEQFQSRCIVHRETAYRLCQLLPRFLDNVTFSDLRPCLSFYAEILDACDSIVEGEWIRWRAKWQSMAVEDRPDSILDSLALCDPNFYPCIARLLQIFATLPVTTLTAERSFSALKLLKTYLRSTTSQERLVGLAHMYIHPEIVIDIDAAIDNFSLLKKRVVQFT